MKERDLVITMVKQSDYVVNLGVSSIYFSNNFDIFQDIFFFHTRKNIAVLGASLYKAFNLLNDGKGS